jgi:glycosyltransferase involved in cell wall biosynthesis
MTAEQRLTLLRGAVALAYPSLFEGFGLPPLEAMALGTPVVASNVSSMPEVLGDAALLVDPLRVDALAQALVDLATSEPRRAELRRRGFDRAARYTTRATGVAALAAFRAAVRTRPAVTAST